MSRRVGLLVAESGGHLEQLTRLEARLRPGFDEVIWVTPPTKQSRSLLEGRTVRFVPSVPPRAWRPALAAVSSAYRLMREYSVTDVVSTGSAIAVPYLMTARSLGVGAHYIESAARTSGPSLSGRMLQHVPGIHLYAQYPQWANPPWLYRGCVFDGFKSAGTTTGPGPARRVVVTLGTISRYPFHRAVDAVMRALSEVGSSDCEVLWQVGDTDCYGRLPGEVHRVLPAKDLRQAFEEADLVVAHAGTGSALQILDAGRLPVLLPRSREHGEHVDDHQQLIAESLDRRGLAVSVDPDGLRPAHLLSAMTRRIVNDQQGSEFTLATTAGAHRPQPVAHRRSLVPAPVRRTGRPQPDRLVIRGIGFDRLTERETVHTICDEVTLGRGGWVVTPNVDIVRLCEDPALRGLVNSAHLVVCDGAPVLWASRLLRDPLPERVTGSSLIWTLTAEAGRRGQRVFLLGAAPGVAERAARRLNARGPGTPVVGSYSPPFGFEKSEHEIGRVVTALEEAQPDIVLTAFGFPKQELLIERLIGTFPRCWFVGCGAAVDMAAGRLERAPEALQRLGLEWMHRLGQEPGRLWRRYLVHDLPYAARLLGRAAVVGARKGRGLES